MNATSISLQMIADGMMAVVAFAAIALAWRFRGRALVRVLNRGGYAIAAGLAASGLFGVASLVAHATGPANGPFAAIQQPAVREAVWMLAVVSIGIGFALAMADARRRRLQAATRESAFHSILENLPGAYIRSDRDGVVRHASKSAAAVLGCDYHDMIGSRSDSFYRSPGDRENLLRMVDEAGGELRLDGVRFRRRDGSVLPISYFARRITDGSDCDGGLEAYIRDLSATHAAETERRKSEERATDFADMGSDWLWETDAEYRLAFLSDSYDAMSGRTAESLSGKLIWDTFDPGFTFDISFEELRRIFEAKERITNILYSFRRPDGEVSWRRLNGKPRFDESGNFIGYRGVTSDITAIIGAEQRFRALIEQSPDMICVHRDDRILYVNRALVGGFGGRDSGDFIGEDPLGLAHPDDRAAAKERRRRQLGGKSIEGLFPIRMQRRDGSDFDGETTLATITWDGEPAIMINIRDVSARSRAEERLRESEGRFRAFAELSSDWLFETDADHKLVWLSDSFHEKTVVPASEILGTTLWNANVSTEGGSARLDQQRRIMEAHEPFRDFVYSLTIGDGRVYWRRMSAQPRFDADGRFAGYRGSTTDITAQRTNERNFRNLIENMPEAIFIQRDDVICYANPAMPTIFGAESADAYVGSDSMMLYHPDEHASIRERRARLRAGDDIPTVDRQRLLRSDGGDFFGEASAAVIEWEGAPAIMVILRDISERVAAEDALTASEEQYRSLAELLPEAYIVICEARIVYANASARDLFGNPSGADPVGRPGLDVVAPECRDWMLARRNRVMTSGQVSGIERGRHVRGDGTFFETESIAAPVDWNGKPGTLNLIIDISDRVAAEKRREESEQRFRDFAEATSDWFWETGPDLRFTWFSTSTHPVNRRPSESILGSRPWEVSGADPANSPGWKRVIDDFIAKRAPFRDQRVEGVLEGGVHYHLSISGVPRFEEDGTFLGYRGSSTDVTNEIDLENRLRQAQKMEAIGQLTGGVAHDFNNLLAIISGNLELLAERISQDNPEWRLLAPALRAVDRGAELTRYLLAFSRQQPLNPRPVEIGGLVVDMTDALRRTLGETVRLAIAVAPDVWLANVDPAQTENAILNLALNARDAMPDGGTITIAIANEALGAGNTGAMEDVTPGDYLKITVADEGVGIPADLIDRVFDPFVTTKDVGQGSGLGLSMVYGFVKQSGGQVRIASEVGKGTTVSMYLPKAEAGQSGVVPFPREDAIPQGCGETVLVVEDDPDVLNLVTVLLTNLNYLVLKADNPASVFAMLENGTPVDLLLTDVILPGGMTGVDLSRQVAERRPDIPIIFMSGYSENANFAHGKVDDDIMLLRKPFKKPDLAKLVQRALAAQDGGAP